jgi:hypothetical protein
MNVISKAITFVVTALPPEKNLVPRFTEEGAQEMMQDALTAYQEG